MLSTDLVPHKTSQLPMARRAGKKTSISNESILARPTYVVLLKEYLRVVVAVNVNLRDSIENGRILATRLHTSLKPGQDELQPITLLHFVHEFVDRDVPSYGRQ